MVDLERKNRMTDWSIEKMKKRIIVRFKELGNYLTDYRFPDESTVDVIVKFYIHVTISAWIPVVSKKIEDSCQEVPKNAQMFLSGQSNFL